MKRYLILFAFLTSLYGCHVEKFSTENPDVQTFVRLIKSGKYNYYQKSETGKNLWLLMPRFSQSDIPALLEFAKDTCHIMEFPVNPLSSRTPLPEGRRYFILSECLLWVVEGIRLGASYGSLDPYMITFTSPGTFRSLTTIEILEVRELYAKWWKAVLELGGNQLQGPLEGSGFRWM